MITRNKVRFEGKRPWPNQILLAMQGDNVSEGVIFTLPEVDASRTVAVKWYGDGDNSDIVMCEKYTGPDAGENDYIWTVRETDTRIPQHMRAWVQVTGADGYMWSSQEFDCYVGDVSDIPDIDIETHQPGIVTQMMEAITAHNAEIVQAKADIAAAVEDAQQAKEDTEAVVENLMDQTTGKIKLQYIPGLTVKRYGVLIPATSQAACERLYEAVGMVANAHHGSYDGTLRNDFDDVFLMKGREQRVNYDLATRRITAVEGDAAFKLDGSNGDVFVRQLPHWHKREILADGSEIRAIADGAIEGYEYVPERLIGCFKASAADADSKANDGSGKIRSVCGAHTVPLLEVSLGNFIAKAKNWGTGSLIMDAHTYADQADMMLIEFATRNMQTAIGKGVSEHSLNGYPVQNVGETANYVVLTMAQAAKFEEGTFATITIHRNSDTGHSLAWNRRVTRVVTHDDGTNKRVYFDGEAVTLTEGCYARVTVNYAGGTEAILKGSGYIGSNGHASVKYRGVEDPYGNCFDNLGGMLKLGTHPPVFYLVDDPQNMSDVITEHYRPVMDYPDEGLGATGYVKDMMFTPNAPMESSLVGLNTGGSETTYWCDYRYISTRPATASPAQLRSPRAGGRWNSAAYAGPWSVIWYYAPAYVAWPSGARLLAIPPWEGVRGS